MPTGLGGGPLGGMPLGGAYYDIATLIGQPSAKVFRRVKIKRRLASTGQYESDWTDITDYITDFGTCERSVDDVKLNRFRHSGVALRARNDEGTFNEESYTNSAWYGFLTRYRTLVKLEGGFSPTTTAEVPQDPSIGVFVMDQEIPRSADSNDITIHASPLSSIFDVVRAVDLTGIYSTLSASDIIARIRDHTDGSGAFIFRQFITSTGWSIQTTTTNYNLTTTAILDMSVMDLITKLAEAEGFVFRITRTGGVEFADRTPNTTASQFTFYGEGFPRQNIIRMQDYREALDKFYTFFRFKWAEPDTSTSYVTAGTTTVVSPSNLSWKYGARVYEFENTFVQTSTAAQSIVNGLFNQFSSVGSEVTIISKFAPHIEVLDRVDVSYHGYNLAGIALWDTFNWDDANWAPEGENFDWDNVNFKVLSVKHDVDNFTSTFKLRRV